MCVHRSSFLVALLTVLYVLLPYGVTKKKKKKKKKNIKKIIILIIIINMKFRLQKQQKRSPSAQCRPAKDVRLQSHT